MALDELLDDLSNIAGAVFPSVYARREPPPDVCAALSPSKAHVPQSAAFWAEEEAESSALPALRTWDEVDATLDATRVCEVNPSAARDLPETIAPGNIRAVSAGGPAFAPPTPMSPAKDAPLRTVAASHRSPPPRIGPPRMEKVQVSSLPPVRP
jgi:hypothetical protein